MLMGHEDRSTTDRYTTIDRLDVKDVLCLIPNIGGNVNKKRGSDQQNVKAS